METHQQRPSRIGGHLIDGAIVVLSLALVAWVGVIVAALVSREGPAGRMAAPPPAAQAAALLGARHHAGWKLVWHDEFSGLPCPSRDRWRFEHGFVRNGELQWYQPQNAYCRDGVLFLEGRHERRPNPAYVPGSPNWKLNRPDAGYTSASITSKYSFTYGRAEALMRIDPGGGSWPAFWTLGTGYRGDRRAWPATGEVDIMEAYRNAVLANVCNPKPTWCGWSSVKQPVDSLGGAAWTDQFHLWAMDWGPRRIRLYLDGRLLNSFATADAARGYRPSPYVGQPAFLLLSEAIGGFNGGHPADSKFPMRLEVKFVRVYQRAGERERKVNQ